MEAHQQNVEGVVGDALDLTVPELDAVAAGERRSYAVYGTAAVSLLLIIAAVSPLAHWGDGPRFAVVAILCGVLAAAFILAVRGLRHLVHLEQAAQNRFLAALAAVRGLAPLESMDLTQRPDTVVLTDGTELSLWELSYTGADVRLVRVPPTPVTD